jgi:hypothetical protein
VVSSSAFTPGSIKRSPSVSAGEKPMDDRHSGGIIGCGQIQGPGSRPRQPHRHQRPGSRAIRPDQVERAVGCEEAFQVADHRLQTLNPCFSWASGKVLSYSGPFQRAGED